MGDTLPLVLDDSVDTARTSMNANEAAAVSRPSKPIENVPSSTQLHQYEELLGGVPCPSCKGAGRIPKELEEQFVALIPLTDKRLKPSKTLYYVILTVVSCLSIGGFVLFFLVPRSLTLTANGDTVNQVKVLHYSEEERKVVIEFINSVLVTNDNYFNVHMINATGNVIRPTSLGNNEVIGKSVNNTRLKVSLKTHQMPVHMNNTAPLTDWAFTMCQYYGFIRLYFQFTLTFEYFGHQEQETLECTQLVCCYKTGNCTELNTA